MKQIGSGLKAEYKSYFMLICLFSFVGLDKN